MLTPQIKAMLEEEELPENLKKLDYKISGLLKQSRNEMGKHYSKWDRNIKTYRGVWTKDEEDYQAQDANEPGKSIIPLSYAQIQTFVSFGFLLYTQNKRFYEMEATGDEDFDLKELIEKGLARDLRQNQWNSKLYQFLLDLARFTIAPLKHWWTIDTQRVDVTMPESITETLLGSVSSGGELRSQELTKYEGNRIKNILPYRFLPDTRKPLSEWSKGQFVADEDEWHITNVKELERKGLAAGTKFVHRMDKSKFNERGTSRMKLVENSFSSKDETDFMVAYTEGNIHLIPAEFDLGPEDFPRLYTFRRANDRLIAIEPQNYLHDEFNYELAQFSQDHEAKLNEGLSDIIHALQETVSWLYNSRMQSVRRSLDSHLIVHPSYVDTATLEARSPIIYLTKNAPVQDIRNVIHQLDVRDTTTSHFADADILMRTMQFVTGVNENSMGQTSGGRRSATENRAANAGAASRMKVVLSCAWDSALGPMGRKLMMNQRQGMSEDTFRKVFGQSDKVMALFSQFAPDSPLELVGNEDFFSFDATLSSEKGFLAQSLQELVIAVVSNPEFAATSGFDLQKAMEEIQTLRGVTNVQRFFRPQPMVPGGLGEGTLAAPQIPGQQGIPVPSV